MLGQHAVGGGRGTEYSPTIFPLTLTVGLQRHLQSERRPRSQSILRLFGPAAAATIGMVLTPLNARLASRPGPTDVGDGVKLLLRSF
jgi:hypothetical protein